MNSLWQVAQRTLPQGLRARQEQGRTRKSGLAERKGNLDLHYCKMLGGSSRWRYVHLLLEGGILDARAEKWKRLPSHTNSVGEAIHVCRERKGASNSEEKKKNGKRNDPGKAQSINGCGAGVKYSLRFRSGSGQAHVEARERRWQLRDKFLGERMRREESVWGRLERVVKKSGGWWVK